MFFFCYIYNYNESEAEIISKLILTDSFQPKGGDTHGGLGFHRGSDV